jgi:hypothetical protein
VRDGTVFQIIRVKWGHGSSLSDYDSTDSQEKVALNFRTGGVVRFGCPCSGSGPPGSDIFQLISSDGGGRLNCASERYQKRLETQLFVNGAQQDIAAPLHGVTQDEIRGSEVDISSTHRVELVGSEPMYIISTYALRGSNEKQNTVLREHFADLDDHLGTCNTSLNMTDRLWTALCSNNYEANEAVECCVIGRCVENIMTVSSIPLQQFYDNQASPFEEGETSEELMGENLLGERSNIMETALICNIITPQYVDVQSALYEPFP